MQLDEQLRALNEREVQLRAAREKANLEAAAKLARLQKLEELKEQRESKRKERADHLGADPMGKEGATNGGPARDRELIQALKEKDKQEAESERLRIDQILEDRRKSREQWTPRTVANGPSSGGPSANLTAANVGPIPNGAGGAQTARGSSSGSQSDRPKRQQPENGQLEPLHHPQKRQGKEPPSGKELPPKGSGSSSGQDPPHAQPPPPATSRHSTHAEVKQPHYVLVPKKPNREVPANKKVMTRPVVGTESDTPPAVC